MSEVWYSDALLAVSDIALATQIEINGQQVMRSWQDGVSTKCSDLAAVDAIPALALLNVGAALGRLKHADMLAVEAGIAGVSGQLDGRASFQRRVDLADQNPRVVEAEEAVGLHLVVGEHLRYSVLVRQNLGHIALGVTSACRKEASLILPPGQFSKWLQRPDVIERSQQRP